MNSVVIRNKTILLIKKDKCLVKLLNKTKKNETNASLKLLNKSQKKWVSPVHGYEPSHQANMHKGILSLETMVNEKMNFGLKFC